MTMGTDFQFQDALTWFRSMDKLIEHVNARVRLEPHTLPPHHLTLALTFTYTCTCTCTARTRSRRARLAPHSSYRTSAIVIANR